MNLKILIVLLGCISAVMPRRLYWRGFRRGYNSRRYVPYRRYYRGYSGRYVSGLRRPNCVFCHGRCRHNYLVRLSAGTCKLLGSLVELSSSRSYYRQSSCVRYYCAPASVTTTTTNSTVMTTVTPTNTTTAEPAQSNTTTTAEQTSPTTTSVASTTTTTTAEPTSSTTARATTTEPTPSSTTTTEATPPGNLADNEDESVNEDIVKDIMDFIRQMQKNEQFDDLTDLFERDAAERPENLAKQLQDVLEQ